MNKRASQERQNWVSIARLFFPSYLIPLLTLLNSSSLKNLCVGLGGSKCNKIKSLNVNSCGKVEWYFIVKYLGTQCGVFLSSICIIPMETLSVYLFLEFVHNQSENRKKPPVVDLLCCPSLSPFKRNKTCWLCCYLCYSRRFHICTKNWIKNTIFPCLFCPFRFSQSKGLCALWNIYLYH